MSYIIRMNANTNPTNAAPRKVTITGNEMYAGTWLRRVDDAAAYPITYVRQDAPQSLPLSLSSMGRLMDLGQARPEPEWLTAAQVAAMIRADLKAAFPGQKFSVRSRRYAGGSSIDVSWTAGPTRDDVDAEIAYLDREGFDGMTDSRTNAGAFTGKDGVQYRMASFIFTHRESGVDNAPAI